MENKNKKITMGNIKGWDGSIFTKDKNTVKHIMEDGLPNVKYSLFTDVDICVSKDFNMVENGYIEFRRLIGIAEKYFTEAINYFGSVEELEKAFFSEYYIIKCQEVEHIKVGDKTFRVSDGSWAIIDIEEESVFWFNDDIDIVEYILGFIYATLVVIGCEQLVTGEEENNVVTARELTRYLIDKKRLGGESEMEIGFTVKDNDNVVEEDDTVVTEIQEEKTYSENDKHCQVCELKNVCAQNDNIDICVTIEDILGGVLNEN